MTTIWLLCRQAPTKIPRERTPVIARLVIVDLLISSFSGCPNLRVDSKLSAEGELEGGPGLLTIFVPPGTEFRQAHHIAEVAA
jgi:hypothetical protein